MAFTFIPNSDIDPGSPITTELMTSLRDNDEFLEAVLRTWVLVENKEISSDVTTVSFTGLNGNTDFAYRLQGRIIRTGATGNYTMEPNGLAPPSGYSTIISTHVNTLDVNTSGFLTDLRFASAAGTRIIQFDILFYARIIVQGVSFRRSFRSIATTLATTSVVNGFDAFGMWDDITTNITSLDIVSSIASDIRTGSHITLYRMTPT